MDRNRVVPIVLIVLAIAAVTLIAIAVYVIASS